MGTVESQAGEHRGPESVAISLPSSTEHGVLRKQRRFRRVYLHWSYLPFPLSWLTQSITSPPLLPVTGCASAGWRETWGYGQHLCTRVEAHGQVFLESVMAMLNPRLKGTPRSRACPVSEKTIAYMTGTDTQVHKTPGARPSQACPEDRPSWAVLAWIITCHPSPPASGPLCWPLPKAHQSPPWGAEKRHRGAESREHTPQSKIISSKCLGAYLFPIKNISGSKRSWFPTDTVVQKEFLAHKT